MQRDSSNRRVKAKEADYVRELTGANTAERLFIRQIQQQHFTTHDNRQKRQQKQQQHRYRHNI